MNWQHEFRERNCFVSLTRTIDGKSEDPRMFQIFPDAKKELISFARDDKLRLTHADVHLEFVTNILPRLYKRYVEESKNGDLPYYTLDEILHMGGYTSAETMCPKTIFNWMRKLGFSYKEHVKSYYTDRHESPENILARCEYIKWYFGIEINCFRWVQLTEKQAMELYIRFLDEEDDARKIYLLDTAYEYKKRDINMLEFHVDTMEEFKEYINDENKKYGGNLSVRKSPTEKPILLIGHDEGMYKFESPSIQIINTMNLM